VSSTRTSIVTGGASFIGSHVVERLVKRGDKVVVVDDLSSGNLDNLKSVAGHYEFSGFDLARDPYALLRLMKRLGPVDTVYHLAADHGGRGYVELCQVETASNFAIDNNVFHACRKFDVPTIVFASSGCIYPLNLQVNIDKTIYLREQDAGPPYEPDGLYGLAKLSAELTLERLWKECGIRSVCCRFFTVYGPRVKENHALGAMIARSFVRQDPFVIWGDGTAIRNWTYVDDIADGMVASEALAKMHGAAVVNLGTMERNTVRHAAETVIGLARELYYHDYQPTIQLAPEMPVGPLNRVAENSHMLALGLEPLPLQEGLRRTLRWYYETHDAEKVRADLTRLLVARK